MSMTNYDSLNKLRLALHQQEETFFLQQQQLNLQIKHVKN